MSKKIAVVILAHNAVGYLFITLLSLSIQKSINYEIILVDNGSRPIQRTAIFILSIWFRVQVLIRLRTNCFFSAGMNIGARLSSHNVSQVLLLNSDVQFKHPHSLEAILNIHSRGATGLRVIENKPVTIADGFCFLIDRDLFNELGGLDEKFPWTRSITKLQADLLRAGHNVNAIRRYEKILVHFGGKSGSAWKSVQKRIELSEVESWFNDASPVRVVEELLPF